MQEERGGVENETEKIFAEAADTLLNFCYDSFVENEIELVRDFEIRAQGRKALKEIIDRGQEPDLDFIRQTISKTGITGFSNEGPWRQNDHDTLEHFFTHWPDMPEGNHDASMEQTY